MNTVKLDGMTKEEACEVLDDMKVKIDIPHAAVMQRKRNEALDMAILALSESMGEWIPVSERLPKEYSFVNCTCHSLVDDRENWVVETVYIPQPPNSPCSDWGNIPMLNDKECEVIAWMYRKIPEPYKGE